MFELKKGDKGQEVKRLQAALKLSLLDGNFGGKTEIAVKEFQLSMGQQQTGVADNAVLSALGIPVYTCIDVSNNNSTVDWQKVAASGVKCAWVKCSEGTTFQDKRRIVNLEGARKNDVIVGGYHFARPDTDSGLGMIDAENEADNFIKALDPIQKGDLRPALDVENGLKSDDNFNAQWVLTFLKHIESKTGVKPIVYTAEWAVDMYLRGAKQEVLQELSTYPVWWASYGGSVEPYQPVKIWKEWAVWQHTGSGEVPGIVGKVDKDWIAGGMLTSLQVK